MKVKLYVILTRNKPYVKILKIEYLTKYIGGGISPLSCQGNGEFLREYDRET